MDENNVKLIYFYIIFINFLNIALIYRLRREKNRLLIIGNRTRGNNIPIIR